MQVFVLRTDLSSTNPPVIASYPDLPVLDRSTHGPGAAVLSLPQTAMQTDPQTRVVTLISTWRTANVNQIVNDEAQRRIEESYTVYMQLTVS